MLSDVTELSSRLSRAGFVAADDEARELIASSGGDESVLASLVERRLLGEPLAWIRSYTTFCGLQVRVDRGVYVPRWQSEPLARRAAERLPPGGVAIDICTGSGAIAKYLRSARPKAKVVASEIDGVSARCAISNGVDVFCGNLFEPLPRDLEGVVDLIIGVVPYVPTHSLSRLPRDTFVFESTTSYDGGEDGVDFVRRVIRESPRFLKPGGALLLEIGGDEFEVIEGDLSENRFLDVVVHSDDDGDVRGVEATLSIRV